jgi:hypothetical protein
LANIEGSVSGTPTVTFTTPFKGGLFTKVTFENTDETKTNVSSYVAGSITIADLTIKTPSFSITNKATGNARVVKNKATPVVIFNGEATTNKDSISISDLKISGVTTNFASWSTEDAIDLTIYVNDTEYVSTATFNSTNTTVTFNNI